MGIPKFFRWISERYPLCSQLIQEDRIPEFDNLYLDMNGIIHNCSHKNDDDVHFRITETDIFLAIFKYIDHVFTKIKPQKLFFLAVDGVAPRAKMNQQRARRFRTAKEAADARRKALAKGEELPKEPPFDSNCITPGTHFMVKLHEQLKYFINKKITEDAAWANVKVILSGHDVPGEGEHKIMEYFFGFMSCLSHSRKLQNRYIRHAKAQPDYAPNIRHCLYGLDADLMMLGLLSHEPHFSLLREEVHFGRERKSAGTVTPDSQNFFLMHLCLFREYLDMEFSSLKESLPFPYDVERIIDDYVLMSFFVGNDFLPHLPGLHINEGALSLMFKIYKRILPTLGGYINENGKLNLERCQKMVDGLADFEKEQFEEDMGDILFLDKKKRGSAKGGKPNNDKATASGPVMSMKQKEMYDQVKTFVIGRTLGPQLAFPANILARDRAFLLKLAKDLGISHSLVVSDANSEHILILELDEEDDESDEESMEARQRFCKRYDSWEVVDEEALAAQLKEVKQNRIEAEFIEWKSSYYKEKLEINFKKPEEMAKIVFSYVEGLQWVLYYYYRGVASWEWFFPFHYAPRATDLTGLEKLDIKFDIGKPFLPFEQLMGVLPAASNAHIPEAYRTLMSDPGSPILDFYPTDFECDLNGKKQDWEAVVKIPFIEERRLLAALKTRENLLTAEEKNRNGFGKTFISSRSDAEVYEYPSTLPGVFPPITNCKCKNAVFKMPPAPNGFRYGLCPNASLGADMLPGFPSVRTLPHTATLGFHGVMPFKVESKNQSVVVTLSNPGEQVTTEQHAHSKLGKQVFVGWPFLWDARVVSMADEFFEYTLDNGQVIKNPHTQRSEVRFFKQSESLERLYSKRYGVIVGAVEVIVQCNLLCGMEIQDDSSLSKEWATQEFEFPVQLLVEDRKYEDPRYKELGPPPLEVEFPIHSQVFFTGTMTYGHLSEVIGYSKKNLIIRIAKPSQPELEVEPTFAKDIARKAEKEDRYVPSFIVAKQLGVSSLAISKIASSMFVMSNRTDQRYNIGLNLKFDSKALKVLGYTQKSEKGWEYSEKAFALIREYYKKFPEIFLAVNRIPARSELLDETLFYTADVVDAKMAEIKSWLKESGAKLLDKAPLNAVALSKDHVEEIQRRMDQLNSSAGPENLTYISVSGVPKQSVLKPEHSKHRLLHQFFSLGDRVVCTFNEGSVPLGTKGTVVGLDGHLVQVLFDKTFMGGTSLDGRCAPYRGGSVSKETLLNLTHQQPFNRSSRPLSSQRGESRGANGTASKSSGRSQNYQPAAPMKNAWDGKRSAENISKSKDDFYQTLGVQKPRAAQSAPAKKVEPPQQASRKVESVPSTKQPQIVKKEEVSSSGLEFQLSRKQQGSASSTPAPTQPAVNTDVMTMNLKSMLKIQGGPGAQPRPPMNPLPQALPGMPMPQTIHGMPMVQPLPGMPLVQPGIPVPQQYPGMVPQQFVPYPPPYGYAPPYGYPPMMPGQISMPPAPQASFRPQSIQTAGIPVAVATKTETVTSVTTQSMGNQNVLHGIMSTLQGQSPSNGSPYSSSTPSGATGWRPPTNHNELEHLVKGKRGGRGSGRGGRGRGRGRGGAHNAQS